MDDAVFIWNGNGMQGVNNITKYITELPSSTTQVECVDCHPLPGELCSCRIYVDMI